MRGVPRVRLLWPFWLVSHSHQDISDLSTVQRLSDGRVDLTFGRLATRYYCTIPVLIPISQVPWIYLEEIWLDFRIWSNGTGLFSQNHKNHLFFVGGRIIAFDFWFQRVAKLQLPMNEKWVRPLGSLKTRSVL